MRICSILLITSDLKLWFHLSRSLFLYFNTKYEDFRYYFPIFSKRVSLWAINGSRIIIIEIAYLESNWSLWYNVKSITISKKITITWNINVGDCTSLEKDNFWRFSLRVTVAWRHQTMTSFTSERTVSFWQYWQIRKW